MATIRNIAGDARDIPLAGGIVDAGDTFDVDDDLFDTVEFSPDLFEVVVPPVKSKPRKKTADTGTKEES